MSSYFSIDQLEIVAPNICNFKSFVYLFIVKNAHIFKATSLLFSQIKIVWIDSTPHTPTNSPPKKKKNFKLPPIKDKEIEPPIKTKVKKRE